MTHTNSLIKASSPYLLQHAHNPVDWFQWSDEAWQKARDENKLVIVSVGYAACHWCHVMEHECFENEETAAIMNEHFICIKVDREERPDVDAVYMDACQLITQRGGWPLNVFCLPDGRPIHAGTYFPRAHWEDLLTKLAVYYQNKPEEAAEYAVKLTEGIKQMDLGSIATSTNSSDDEIINQVVSKWQTMFDPVLGGYNWAPKFPMPSNYSCLLHLHSHICNPNILFQVENTLKKMALGGIYDQLGGGFARYSVDSEWKVPHFEKMLYDNAQLISLYSKAYSLNKKSLYIKIINETIEFCNRELRHDNGLYYSALDADSEGVEGKFYVWTKNEITHVLGADADLFIDYFRIDQEASWEHDWNVLMATQTLEEYAESNEILLDIFKNKLEKCCQKLIEVRSKKIRPSLDDKTICSWNALMISALCDAYAVTNLEAYKIDAIKTADTLLQKLYINKKLYRIWKNEKHSIPAFSEDYSILAQSLIRLYEITFDETYIQLSKELIEISFNQFYDSELGFFKMKSNEDTPLFADKIDVSDDVIPSANSVYAHVLYRLGFYYSNLDYIAKANEMVDKVKAKFHLFPTGYSNWIELLLIRIYGLNQVVYTQLPDEAFKRELSNYYVPNLIFGLSGQLPLTENKADKEFKVYLCKDFTCQAPVETAKELVKNIFNN